MWKRKLRVTWNVDRTEQETGKWSGGRQQKGRLDLGKEMTGQAEQGRELGDVIQRAIVRFLTCNQSVMELRRESEEKPWIPKLLRKGWADRGSRSGDPVTEFDP